MIQSIEVFRLTRLCILLYELKVDDSETSAEVRKAGRGIMKAFKKVSNVAMPEPVQKVTRASEENSTTKSTKVSNLCVSGEFWQ